MHHLSQPSIYYYCRTDKEEILSKDRCVKKTADAEAKDSGEPAGGAQLESVFSAAVLPTDFYQDLIKGHSAKGILDLSVGQGCSARAALLERVPFVGFALTEQHSKRLEVQLTDFVVAEMKREGSTHYRPEACNSGEVDGNSEEGPQPKPKPAAKNNSKNKGKPPKNKNEKEEEGEEAPEPPQKKPKTEEAADDDEENETLPW